MRIIELPDQLCASGKPAVAVLVARPDSKTVSHSIYLGENAGGGDPSTYSFLASNTRFAQRGVLVRDYIADTPTIDRAIGPLLQLEGPDLILDEQTLFRALANELLCIIDDEIMSVVDAELRGPGLYRLEVIRRRFGTERASHAAETEVYLLPLTSLQSIQHDHFQPGNTVVIKVTAAAADVSEDLADVDPVSATLRGRLFELPPVGQLAVDGITRNAVYDSALDFDITWLLPALNGVDTSGAYTLLEFLEADVVTHSEEVAWPLITFNFTYPGTPPGNFILRASIVIDTGWEKITGPGAELFVAEHDTLNS